MNRERTLSVSVQHDDTKDDASNKKTCKDDVNKEDSMYNMNVMTDCILVR